MPGTCAVLVTAAPLARRAADVAAAVVAAGWSVAPVLTPNAVEWVDQDGIAAAAGSPGQSTYVGVGDTGSAVSPRDADVVVVCPGTFNTVVKAAVGVADTYAHSLLAELVGRRVPTVVVPMVNRKLWGHPAWRGHLDMLAGAGVRFLDPHTGREGLVPVESGSGDAVVAGFEPLWITAALANITS